MLTPAQLIALKADINANTNTINLGGNNVQIKDTPNNLDTNTEIANQWYNLNASPNYFVWRSSITRSEIYHTLSLDNTIWDWAAYKSQSQSEQGSWTQMFMGDATPMSNLNLRNGVFNIFSGSAPQNAQRGHIFSVGRRQAKRIEKLFAAAPVNAGGITVGPNNGNTTTDAVGASTNPGVMGFEGLVTGADISAARNS